VDLRLVERWYPISSTVIVHLRGGRSTEGTLAAIDGDSLVLVTRSGPTLLLADAIDQVESAGAAGSPNSAPAPASPARPTPANVAKPRIGPPPPLWASLEAEFAPDSQPPEFSAPVLRRDPTLTLSAGQAAAVDREMQRAASKYAHAVKIRDRRRRRNGSRTRPISAAPTPGISPCST
jgi:hypothetical protein